MRMKSYAGLFDESTEGGVECMKQATKQRLIQLSKTISQFETRISKRELDISRLRAENAKDHNRVRVFLAEFDELLLQDKPEIQHKGEAE